MMGTNQQTAPQAQAQPSIISKEEEEEKSKRRNMENNEAYIIEVGYRGEKRARLGGDKQTPVFPVVDQRGRGPWPHHHQYDTSSSNHQSPAFGHQQQADILRRQSLDRTGPGQQQQQHAEEEEAQVGNGNQRHRHLSSRNHSVRTQTALMAQIGTLNQQLQQEKREKEYFKLMTLEFYWRLCILEPGMPAGHGRRAETLFASNSNTPPTFTPIPSSVTIPSDTRPSRQHPSAALSASRPFAPPPSAATPPVPHPPIPHPSIPGPSASRPYASRLSAHHPPADRSSAARPSALCHGAVISSTSSRHTPHSASPVTASALHIDLTIDDDIPPSSHTSQKRKWAARRRGKQQITYGKKS